MVSSKYNDEEDCFNNNEAFTQAMMIATLAELFNLTEFKPFQKIVIDNLMSGNDYLVIQPTGSGKSLCYQFPAIYGNKVSFAAWTQEYDKLSPSHGQYNGHSESWSHLFIKIFYSFGFVE